MARYWQLLVKAQGDTKPAVKAMRDLKRSSRNLQKAIGVDFGRIAKVSAFALGAGLAASIKIGVDEFQNARVVSAQLDAALANNGKSAGQTRAAMDKLASSLAYKASIDDELITAAQAQTLAFTNVRDIAGEGNDVFTRLTQTSVDYAAATGKDLVQAQKKFATALNDPTKGARLLRSVGISLTKQQQKQIKTFTESGDVLSAQKIILRELENRYKGMSKQVGDQKPFERLKNTFANLMATLVSGSAAGFTPFLNHLSTSIKRMDDFFKSAEGQKVLADLNKKLKRLADALVSGGKKLGDAIEKMYKWRGVLIPLTKAVVALWAAWKAYKIIAATSALFSAFKAVIVTNTAMIKLYRLAVMASKDALNLLRVAAVAATGVIKKMAWLAWRGAVLAYRSALLSTKTALLAVRSAAILTTKAVTLLNVAMRRNPIVIVISLLVALGAALVVAWKKSEQFRKVVTNAFERVKAAAWALPKIMVEVGAAIVNGIKQGVENAAGELVNYVAGLGGRMKDALKRRIQSRSPSKLFAREIGKPIAEGIAVGIRNNIEKTTQAMDALADQMQKKLSARLRRINLRQAFLDYKLAEVKYMGGDVSKVMKQQLAAVQLRIRTLKDFLKKNAKKLRADQKESIFSELAGLLDTAAGLRGDIGMAGGVIKIPAAVNVDAMGQMRQRQASSPALSKPVTGNTYNVTVNASQPVDSVAFMRSLQVASRMGTI